jgi:hypothetical protein
MRLRRDYLAVPLLILLFNCCAPSRLVKPLAKGQKGVSATFGGPLIRFGGAIVPLPFTTVGFAHGATSRITTFANLHPTSLLFGNVQADGGALFSLWSNEKSGITVSPQLQFAFSAKNGNGFRCWPSFDLNYYHHFGARKSYAYAGAGSWFEPAPRKAFGEDRTRLAVPSLHAGYTFANTKWQQQLEAKLIAPGISNLPNVVDYVGISHKGSFGLYYSIVRKF